MKMNKSSLLCIVVLSFSGLISAQEPSRPHPEASLPCGTAGRCSLPAKWTTKARPLHSRLPAQGLVCRQRAHDGGRGTGQAQGLSRSVFRDESADFPGVTYPIGANFSNIPMQPDSPFIVPWWYRKEFVLPAELQGQDHLAEFRRHQLPRQHLAERQAARQV